MNHVFHSIDPNRIRSRIVHLDLKHYWLAECAGVHKTTLRRWLNQRILKVRSDRLERLATLLEVSANELMAHGSC